MPLLDRLSTARDTVTREVAQSVRWGFGQALPQFALGAAARKGDLHGRLVANTVDGAEMPIDLFDEVRADGPLHRSKLAFVTASLPTVKEALTNHDMHSGVEFQATGALGAVADWAWAKAPMGPLNPPSLLVIEPPDHTRYRKLVTRVFTVRAVERLRSRTQEIANELLDDIAAQADGPVDLVETYCARLPVTVIAEILGVPEADRATVLDFGTAAAPSLDLGLGWRRFRAVDNALLDFDHWLADHLDAVRRNPGDDLLSKLVAARDDDGNGLDQRELKATAGLVLAAGFETTVNLLSNGIALLHEHPDQLDLLRNEPDRWPNAVEEILRFDPPVLLTGRTAEVETTIAGRRVPKGAIVTALLAGANRDPEIFSEPNAFDVTRENAGDHVSFSAGRHYCLGAALARMEGEVGLRTIAERFPDLRLLDGATRRSTRILRGWENLPVAVKG